MHKLARQPRLNQRPCARLYARSIRFDNTGGSEQVKSTFDLRTEFFKRDLLLQSIASREIFEEIMIKRKITTLYRCKSAGPRNNGLLKSCDFQFAFEVGVVPHCPLCGEKLSTQESKNSVSKILREGFLKEKLNK